MIDGKEITPAHDYWCLGILVYELLTGVTPFHSDSDEKTMKFIKNLPIYFSHQNCSHISEEAKDFVKF